MPIRKHVVCVECGNDYLTDRDPNAEKIHDRPRCKCKSRRCKVIKK